MSENALSAPTKVEYVILAPRRKRLWPGVAAFLLIAGLAIGVYLLMHRKPDEVHVYKPEPLPAIGLTASLKTKWVNGSLQYLFQVRPIQGTETRFLAVVSTVPLESLRFVIHLLDKDGFEVCGGPVKMHRSLGKDGNPVALSADQVLVNCSKDQMQRASKWRVSHDYPLLNADLVPTPKPTNMDGQPHSQRPGANAPRNSEGTLVAKPSAGDGPTHSRLTGTDAFTGEIETLDKGSFKVVKHAEVATLAMWSASDEIEISCKQRLCIVTDLSNQQSVHAEKRRD